jgi:hypothetical protein
MPSHRVLGAILLAAATAAGVPAAPQEQSIPSTPLQAPAIPSAPPIAIPPPLPTGPAPDLELLFTGQVAGYVEPCG